MFCLFTPGSLSIRLLSLARIDARADWADKPLWFSITKILIWSLSFPYLYLCYCYSFSHRFLFLFSSEIPNFSHLTDDQLKLMIQTNPDSGKPSCGLCLKGFSIRAKVLDHLKVIHANRADQKCSYCPLAFGTKAHLGIHISRKHLEVHRMKKLLNKAVCTSFCFCLLWIIFCVLLPYLLAFFLLDFVTLHLHLWLP